MHYDARLPIRPIALGVSLSLSLSLALLRSHNNSRQPIPSPPSGGRVSRYVLNKRYTAPAILAKRKEVSPPTSILRGAESSRRDLNAVSGSFSALFHSECNHVPQPDDGHLRILHYCCVIAPYSSFRHCWTSRERRLPALILPRCSERLNRRFFKGRSLGVIITRRTAKNPKKLSSVRSHQFIWNLDCTKSPILTHPLLKGFELITLCQRYRQSKLTH